MIVNPPTSKISFHNLDRVAMELGENSDGGQMQDMINQIDGDGSDEINVDKSYSIMKKGTKDPWKHASKKQKVILIEQLAVSNSTGSTDWNGEAELIKSLLSQTNKCND